MSNLNASQDQLFEKASRLKLRFDSARGQLTVEDLWDIGTTRGAVNLNDLAKQINRQLKTTEEEGLVKTRSAANDLLQLKLDVLTYVFGVRQEEADRAKQADEKRETRQKLAALIAQKQDQQLGDKSIEELQAMLNATQE
ncbi:hypothetical protein HWB57_gp102 [Erwinia phage vB_EamM-Bue1]|uniref:Uncharacterized protein n=2 Tax=Nezavisimistyvirus TaxID=2841279 RepID=A0A0A0YR78_9CAUD|nr:hypothetical protein NW77_089 [Erwinia phage phiEa2809]YP_009837701.1 hypothetical protein HWB57_gp102 [Erwinia phage vB_EamM-Bue1]AIX13097.1 hypothetical protein NW77_089 [Erwinia phage phiEa2809]AVO22942.1 hypothetical protein [Erwinia phage vB_EamM-Bue1]